MRDESTSGSSKSRTGNPRVAVIGAGISGLAAAAYLAERLPDADIDIYEASSRAGGVLQTERRGDLLIEQAADNFATQEGKVADLHRVLRLDPPLIKPNETHRLARVLYRGRLHPIPKGFSLLQPTRLSSVFASTLFSPAGKARIAAEQFVPRRRDTSDESLQDFAIRRLGREAFERLIEPVVCGIFTAKADRLSMQAALPQFVRMEQEHGSLIRAARAAARKRTEAEPIQNAADAARMASGARYDIFQAPADGMSAWINSIIAAMPNRVQIHYETPVESILRFDEHRWQITTRNGESGKYDGCVIALNARQAAGIVQTFAPETSFELSSIRYADSVVVVLEVDASAVPAESLCFGIVVPTAAGDELLAISFSSLKYAGRASEDRILMRVFLGGAVHPEVDSWPDGRVAAHALTRTTDILNLKAAPNCLSVYRWPRAMPQYELGHLQRVEKIEAAAASLGSLRFCGNAYRGVGIPQCIASGRRAAEDIAGLLDAAGQAEPGADA